MGRKKIKIQPIKEDRNRSVTYLKRKAGLFKKAHELAVLTDSQVAVIVFGHNGKLAEFCSTDMDLVLLRYTEYDGIAERKGPHNYHNDSDDNDDDDNDDNDDMSGDNPSDDLAGSSRANGRGATGGANHARSISGTKRKAGQISSSSRDHALHNPTLLAGNSGLGTGFGIADASTAKQTVNAAIRRKSQNQSSGASSSDVIQSLVPGQGAYQPMPFSQTFGTNPSMRNSMVGAPLLHLNVPGSNSATSTATTSGTAGQSTGSSASANLNREQDMANMSISMPSNDRLPMFVSPAPSGFGLTPGGTVVTPGGRRFSFSDVLPRGPSNSTIQRPVTSHSQLLPQLLPNETLGLTVTPSQDASFAAAFASSSPLMDRDAATAFQRSIAPMYGQGATHAPVSDAVVASANTQISAADIVRPFTAAPDLELASAASHLGLPVADFAHNLHASSASPVSHPGSANVNNATGASSSSLKAGTRARSLQKTSATPFGGSQHSSATPELLPHGNNAFPRPGLAASTSRSSASTDEETPPAPGVGAVAANHGKMDSNPTWLQLGQGLDRKPDQIGPEPVTLVQPAPVNPAPVNPAPTFEAVPFELKLPLRRKQ